MARVQKYSVTSFTAIKVAAENGHIEVVKVLLSNPRVDPSIFADYGRTGMI